VRKLWRILAALAVPALLVLNAVQGFRYHRLAQEVSALEDRQRALLEANRDAIAGIAGERSAGAVERRARDLGLQTVDPSQVTKVLVGPETSP